MSVTKTKTTHKKGDKGAHPVGGGSVQETPLNVAKGPIENQTGKKKIMSASTWEPQYKFLGTRLKTGGKVSERPKEGGSLLSSSEAAAWGGSNQTQKKGKGRSV